MDFHFDSEQQSEHYRDLFIAQLPSDHSLPLVWQQRGMYSNFLDGETIDRFEGFVTGHRLALAEIRSQLQNPAALDETGRPLFLVPPSLVCQTCNNTGERDSGGTQPWGEAISVPCGCPITSPDLHGQVRQWVKQAADIVRWHYGITAKESLPSPTEAITLIAQLQSACTSPDPLLDPQLLEELRKVTPRDTPLGWKIPAIKLCRDLTGRSLPESRAYVDLLVERHKIQPPLGAQ